MNKETIGIVLQFLDRVSLRGNEVDAFNKVKQSLISEYNKVVEAEKPSKNPKPKK